MQYRRQEIDKTEAEYCPIDIDDDIDADLEYGEDKTDSDDKYNVYNLYYTYTLPTCLLHAKHTEESLLAYDHVLREDRIEMDEIDCFK